jgi:hypothetical protein
MRSRVAVEEARLATAAALQINTIGRRRCPIAGLIPIGGRYQWLVERNTSGRVMPWTVV